MRVSNNKCIFNISKKNMRYTNVKNIIAVIAVILTTLLFTSLFTIIVSIKHSFEQSNFRMTGTSSHCQLKNLTKDQCSDIADDNAVKEYGIRRILASAKDDKLSLSHSEISYMDENAAEMFFASVTNGSFPHENTLEAAADTNILKRLGIPLKTGQQFSVSFMIDDNMVTEQFTLCGWWSGDDSSPASHILIPDSRIDEILQNYQSEKVNDGTDKSYTLCVMFENSSNITSKADQLIARKGFSSDPSDENRIDIGVNWGYAGNSDKKTDGDTILSVAAIILIIMITGYLIIYNVFRISVSNEIRYYGMLKTIGTTGKQIKKVILFQAFVISAAGIPAGCILGWIFGNILMPFVANEINIMGTVHTSVSPSIFIFSAFFSLITVFISCQLPAGMAAKASPVEALRYTEPSSVNGFRKGKKGISLSGMAAANLAGGKGKTTVTIVSLSLSILIFALTATFANSFSFEKYLSNIKSDFVISDRSYFNTLEQWDEKFAVSDKEIEILSSLEGVTDCFATYGISATKSPKIQCSEASIRNQLAAEGASMVEIDKQLESMKSSNGKYFKLIQMMGVKIPFYDKINVLEGDISKLSNGNYIAVNKTENYKLGEKISLDYTDSAYYYNSNTGAIYSYIEDVPEEQLPYTSFQTTSHTEKYEIAAIVDIPEGLTYRYTFKSDLFIIDSQEFIKQNPNSAALYVCMDVTDEYEDSVEEFMENYASTSRVSYSSKKNSYEEFESFRKMFIIMGSSLSLIVGLIGTLNFVNTILTGIFSRRKEIASLQAIGMTGRQLKIMLIFEGLIYTFAASAVSVILNLLTIPLSDSIEKIFWFCEFKFTFIPALTAIPLFILMGIVIPCTAYKIISRKTVVDRLRTGN